MRGSHIGADCTIGRNAHVEGTRIGDRCKVQTFAYMPPGTTLEDEVFIGPAATFCNHKRPRAVRRPGEGEFEPEGVTVEREAVLGANATIGPGVTIGEGAFVQMGARVWKDVPAGAKVYGPQGLCVKE